MFCQYVATQPNHCQFYVNCSEYRSHEPYGICIHETETRWILTMKQAGIGKRYWEVEFDTLPQAIRESNGYQKARYYASHLPDALNQGRGWWLFGKNGVGKTSLLICILKEALRQGHSALLVEAPELSAILGRRRNNEEEMNAHLEDRVFQDDFILLDDLGAEGDDEDALAWIQRIILRRVNEMKPILIACDLEPGVILSRWKKAGMNRIINRLQAVSMISILRGKSLRKREGEGCFYEK